LHSDIGLSAKWGAGIRENPTRCATYNPAGGGFHNRPDPDSGADNHPSLTMIRYAGPDAFEKQPAWSIA